MVENAAGRGEAKIENESADARESKSKSQWVDLVKAVAMPLVTLVLGFWFNASLNSRQARENASLSLRQEHDNNMRLNAEMMGRRIEADGALRKDMLQSILNAFGRNDMRLTMVEQLDQQLLNLELLASNFQESLDLKPLFEQVRRRIPEKREGPYAELRRRLEKLAQEVNGHQLTELSEGGIVEIGEADTEKIRDLKAYLSFGQHALADPSFRQGEADPRLCLSIDSTDAVQHQRQFKLEIMNYDPLSREVQVRLYVSRVVSQEECKDVHWNLIDKQEIDTTLMVGLFDFPVIHNMRLTGGERCAVSLTDLTPYGLRVALVYFPGSRARLNYDEVMQGLIRDHQLSEPRKH
jgi:DNA-binding transcriptional ArsR family regulator